MVCRVVEVCMLALAQPCSIIGEHMIGAFHHPKYESIWSFRPEKNGGAERPKRFYVLPDTRDQRTRALFSPPMRIGVVWLLQCRKVPLGSVRELYHFGGFGHRTLPSWMSSVCGLYQVGCERWVPTELSDGGPFERALAFTACPTASLSL